MDRLIFSLINKRQIQAKHFSKEIDGVLLNKSGHRIFVEEWENKLRTTVNHPKLKRKVSYRTLVRLELYKIEKHLLEEQPYEPYIAKW